MKKVIMSVCIILSLSLNNVFAQGDNIVAPDPDAIHPVTRAAITTAAIPMGGRIVSNWAVVLTAEAIVNHKHPSWFFDMTIGSAMKAQALSELPKAKEYGTMAGVAGTALLLSFTLDYAYPSWKRVLRLGSKKPSSDDWLRVCISGAAVGGSVLYFVKYPK